VTVERVRDLAQVPVDDRLDVPLVPCLRPAALVVLPRHLGRLVGQRRELPRAKPVDVAALAADVRDERAVPAAGDPHERREVELRRDPRVVLDRPRQLERDEEVVEPGGEDGDAADTLAAELALEPGADPLEVRLERPALVVPERAPALVELAIRAREQRPRACREIAGGRHLARVEAHVQAHRTTLLRPEGGELA
jgi:hypothetical protein